MNKRQREKNFKKLGYIWVKPYFGDEIIIPKEGRCKGRIKSKPSIEMMLASADEKDKYRRFDIVINESEVIPQMWKDMFKEGPR